MVTRYVNTASSAGGDGTTNATSGGEPCLSSSVGHGFAVIQSGGTVTADMYDYISENCAASGMYGCYKEGWSCGIS